jgi:hypothetical protein
VVYGLNNNGVLVGEDFNTRGGFEDSSGIFTALNYPGALQTIPGGINDSGVIVGVFAENFNSPFNGFEDNGGVFTTTGSLLLGSINNSGVILVGGGLYSGGMFTAINYPGGVLTESDDISNNGLIVGEYFDGLDASHGFLDSGGAFTTIDYPGAVDTVLVGVNDSGVIVGVADFGVPEPAPIYLTAGCVMFLLLLKHKRTRVVP